MAINKPNSIQFSFEYWIDTRCWKKKLAQLLIKVINTGPNSSNRKNSLAGSELKTEEEHLNIWNCCSSYLRNAHSLKNLLKCVIWAIKLKILSYEMPPLKIERKKELERERGRAWEREKGKGRKRWGERNRKKKLNAERESKLKRNYVIIICIM